MGHRTLPRDLVHISLLSFERDKSDTEKLSLSYYFDQINKINDKINPKQNKSNTNRKLTLCFFCNMLFCKGRWKNKLNL